MAIPEHFPYYCSTHDILLRWYTNPVSNRRWLQQKINDYLVQEEKISSAKDNYLFQILLIYLIHIYPFTSAGLFYNDSFDRSISKGRLSGYFCVITVV